MDLTALFRPETMAVVGLSLKNDRHPANIIYDKNHLRYRVRTYAVSRRSGLYQGEEVYSRISDLPEKIDLAVIATRAETVPEVFSDCIDFGVKSAVVISAGFAEMGRRDLQDRIESMSRDSGVPVVGPNCLGVYSPPYVDTFFLPGERMVKPDRGGVALVSQSGGLLVDQMVKFAGEGVGLSSAVSIGNKAVVRELDLLDYFCRDVETRVIAYYIEGFHKNEGREFVTRASACSKPVVVLKAGRSSGGSRAVQSHTSVMAGDHAVFSAVMSQFGIMEAATESEFVSFCEALSCYGDSGPREGKVGIVTGSGGHGALGVDACDSRGLSVPVLSRSFQDELKSVVASQIRSIGSFGNPIDLTGSATDEDFISAARLLSRSDEVDLILLLLLPYVPGISPDLGARLGRLYLQEKKPMIAYVPHVERYRVLVEGFELNRVPVAHSIEDAAEMADAVRGRKRADT